jgi:anti-sigma factor (TIGR02949 family)
MDCSQTPDAIYLCFDQEMEAEQRALFEQHLEACPPCARRNSLTARWLRLLRQRTVRLCASAELRHKILEAMAQATESRTHG